MKTQLPERPDFGQLKKQAKELLAAVHADRPDAVARVAGKNVAAADFALHDAQRVIAHEYGFASWARLKLHVETRAIDAAEARLIEAALGGEEKSVRAILAERPVLATRSGFAAAALGEEATVRAVLAKVPGFAKEKGGPRAWTPLLYVCFGRCGAGDVERAALAKALLAGGADPNESWIHPDWPEAPLPVLYGATGVNHYPRVARVLLEAGANPNDGESRYHAAEHHHVAALEVLAEFGADFSGVDKAWGNTPLYFLLGYRHPPAETRAGIRWLLAHGADPNVVSRKAGGAETALHAAVRNDWDAATIELLLAYGADPGAKRGDGRTAYALAVRSGRMAVAELLSAGGAPGEVAPADRFLGACLQADGERARELLRTTPELMQELPAEERKAVLDAAREGRAAALSLMGELGFDLNVAGEDGERALHWAAWHGWVDAVRALIAARVELSADDRRFGAPPTGWCAHGSEAGGNPAGAWGEVMEALLAAGAKVAPNTCGSAEVMAVLKRHGSGEKRSV